MFTHNKRKTNRWEYLQWLVVICDQATKALLVSIYPPVGAIHVLPHFNLSMAYNHGAAFGLLENAGGWQRWFFVALAIVIYCIGLIWSRRLNKNDNVEGVGIALVMGGAIGNVIDRIHYGYVVDFIDFYVGSWHWYTFNVADIAICIGAILIASGSLRDKYRPSHSLR